MTAVLPTAQRTAGAPALAVAFIAAMAVTAIVDGYLRVGDWLDPQFTPEIPWWWLVPFIVVAEYVVVRPRIGSREHAFSLSQLPLTVGLLLATPADTLLAVTFAWLAVPVVVRRLPLQEIGFELTARVLTTIVSITVVKDWAGTTLGPSAWAAVLGALLLGTTVHAVATAVVQTLHGHTPGLRPLLHHLARQLAVSLLLGCTGVVVATSLHGDPRSWVVLLVLAGAVVLAYRVHSRLDVDHRRVTLLHDFGKQVTGERDVSGTAVAAVLGVRDALNAEAAELVVLGAGAESDRVWSTARTDEVHVRELPGEDPARWSQVVEGGAALHLDAHLRARTWYRDAFVVPLTDGEEVIGTLLIANPLRKREFDERDVDFAETLAGQTALVLRNVRLLDQLRHEATHDALTGLANRVMFRRSVDVEFARIRRGASRGAALAVIDLDGFKAVNDTLGHHAGDALLGHVARMVERTLDGSGVLAARLGGDEFALLMPDLDDPTAAEDVAARVDAAVRHPLSLGDGTTCAVGASIGVALSDPLDALGETGDAGEDSARVLARADAAMYEVKAAGGGVRLHLSPGMAGEDVRRLAREVRTAVLTDQLLLHGQPIVDGNNGRVVGAEILLRWEHPRLGMLGPGRFLELAADQGLMTAVDDFVLSTAVRTAAQWQEQGLDLRVSVNLATASMTRTGAGDPGFESLSRRLADLLGAHRLTPDRVVVELPRGELPVVTDHGPPVTGSPRW